MARPKKRSWEALYGTIVRLRGPGGCPWDRAQTLRSLRCKLVEETYEVLEALSGGHAKHVGEELGDLQCLLMMLVAMAEQKRWLRTPRWLAQVTRKLVRRHPHVFRGVRARTAQEAYAHWEREKVHERRGEASVFTGLRSNYPQLLLAEKIQRRVARVGFDWPDARGVVRKVREEMRELDRALARNRRREITGELGDLLFSVVNLARKLGLDAETVLWDANRKFKQRFRALERRVRRDGRRVENLSLRELDRIWSMVLLE